MSNGDNIREMKDAELACFLCDIQSECSKCPGANYCNEWDGRANGLIVWLRQEAECSA